MRTRYRISEKAIQDLEDIWLYTFKTWSKEQADRYYQLIIDEIEFVSKNNESGKDMGHIKIGYKASKVKSHLIFFRKVDDSSIEVIRILHQQMDIEKRL
jgi:toxin ParE1/3/4